MHNLPLVSVIIPNYNHAKYLDRRLQTVLNQTYPNFEVWILDDKSTDNSLEVIAKYEDNPHVAGIVVNDKNSGSPFKQWRKGMELAKGDFVWIAESDDYCELTFLERMMAAHKRYRDAVVLYCYIEMVDENGTPWSRHKSCNPVPIFSKNGLCIENLKEWGRYAVRSFKFRTQHISGKSYMKRFLSMYCSIENASGAVFKREVALNIEPYYLNMKGAGDYMFWTQMAERGNVVFLHETLSYCRRHDGVITNKYNSDGSNMMDEMFVQNYIRNIVHISPLRKRLIRAYHAYKIERIQFSTKEIQQQIYRVWNVPDNSKLDEMLLSVWFWLKTYIVFYV